MEVVEEVKEEEEEENKGEKRGGEELEEKEEEEEEERRTAAAITTTIFAGLFGLHFPGYSPPKPELVAEHWGTWCACQGKNRVAYIRHNLTLAP